MGFIVKFAADYKEVTMELLLQTNQTELDKGGLIGGFRNLRGRKQQPLRHGLC
jgi:hypothetical protein